MAYSSQATNSAFDYIVGMISKGIWEPGTRIATEEQLCKTLNISRTAVRQAIEKLSALSVLKKIQGSGTYVNAFEDCSIDGMVFYPPTKERMLTVLEFRKQFDSYNAELFAANATDDELAQLRKNYNEMIELKNDEKSFQIHENDFHQMIAEGTHNAIIKQIATMMTAVLIRYQMLQYDNIGPDNSIKWHLRILEALEAHDGEMAKLCVKVHLENSIEYLQKKQSIEKDAAIKKNTI